MAIDARRDAPAARRRLDGAIVYDSYRAEAARLRRKQVSLLFCAFVAALKPRPAPQPTRGRCWRTGSWHAGSSGGTSWHGT
jgi:hypothetical protein